MAKKVLMVEDEKLIGEVLERKVREAGYDVTLVADGSSALELMAQLKPDVVLLDIVLPSIDGFEVMEEMQKNPEISSIPVIIVSNSGQPVELDRAKALGAKDWLLKTEFDPQELVDKIRKQIG